MSEDLSGTSADEFKPGEEKELREYASLYKSWGYRMGEGGSHTAFEQQTHNSNSYDLQRYSDMLFRALQQIDNNKGVFLDSDLIAKANLVPDFSSSDYKETRHEITGLLNKYLSIKKNKDMMKKLAEDIIANPNRSLKFKFINNAAKTLLLIAEGEHKTAYNITNALVKKSKQTQVSTGKNKRKQDKPHKKSDGVSTNTESNHNKKQKHNSTAIDNIEKLFALMDE